jgi:phosphate transport system permease protein
MATTTAPGLTLSRRRRLPRWFTWASLGASVALAAGLLAVGGAPTATGVAIFGALLHVGFSTLVSWRVEGRRHATNRLATTVVTGAFVIAMVPLVSLVWTVLAHGLAWISWEFLTTDMVGVYGDRTDGGVLHAVVGTLVITLWAAIISVPIGILTAVYLVEYGRGALARAITFLVDVMTGIPSIVAGLFAFALFTLFFGPAYRAGIMGAAALALLMTPVVVRSVEEMLRLVPNELREAALALGVPTWLMVIKVVLRTAAAGIVTGVMLAVARVVGETAPLLITVGFIAQVNADVFTGRMTTLPVYAFREYSQGGVGVERAWAAALVLIVLVMLLNLAARLASRFFAPKGAR